MENRQKEEIREALRRYVAKYPSQNKAAQSLRGTSAATLSAILGGKWENISADMWRNLQAQVGDMGQAEWQTAETTASQEMRFALEDAQRWKNVTWVVGEAGCGKTTTARQYEAEHSEVFYILCSEDMRRGDFIRDIARRIGIRTDGQTLRDSLDAITVALVQMEHPLLVFDEADKLSDQVMFFFITFYNKLEDYCGIVLMATDYLEKKVRRGLRLNKKGYKEIYSRIGRRFVAMPGLSATDISDVCRANGVEGLREIETVKKDCEGDLRRVKRKCHAFNRMRRQAEERKEETAE